MAFDDGYGVFSFSFLFSIDYAPGAIPACGGSRTERRPRRMESPWEAAVFFLNWNAMMGVAEIFIGLLLTVAVLALVARKLHIPYPILFVVGGLLLGLIDR